METPERLESKFNPMIISLEEMKYDQVPGIDKVATMAFCGTLIGVFNDHIRHGEYTAAQHLYEVVNLMTRTWEKRDPVFWQRQLAHLMHEKLRLIEVTTPKAIEMSLSDAMNLGAQVATIIKREDDAAV